MPLDECKAECEKIAVCAAVTRCEKDGECTLHCAGGATIAAECDCRVFVAEDGPLHFYHLSPNEAAGALDALDGTDVSERAAELAPVAAALAADDGADGGGGAGLRAKALASVELERLKILVVEDDVFSITAITELCK